MTTAWIPQSYPLYAINSDTPDAVYAVLYWIPNGDYPYLVELDRPHSETDKKIYGGELGGKFAYFDSLRDARASA